MVNGRRRFGHQRTDQLRILRERVVLQPHSTCHPDSSVVKVRARPAHRFERRSPRRHPSRRRRIGPPVRWRHRRSLGRGWTGCEKPLGPCPRRGVRWRRPSGSRAVGRPNRRRSVHINLTRLRRTLLLAAEVNLRTVVQSTLSSTPSTTTPPTHSGRRRWIHHELSAQHPMRSNPQDLPAVSSQSPNGHRQARACPTAHSTGRRLPPPRSDSRM